VKYQEILSTAATLKIWQAIYVSHIGI